MKKIILFVVCSMFAIAHSSAQTIEGVIRDAKTQQNVSYVNIGIIGKATGTVSDNSGHYTLTLNNNNTDSLKISMIGYAPQTYLVSTFLAAYTPGKIILLAPVVHQLAEVKIAAEKLNKAVLGNTTQSKTTDAGFTSGKLGNEIGEIIKIKKSPTYLKQFNASLAHPAADSVKLRLNFYSVDGKLPDKILQQQNIFVTVKKGDEKISVDLMPYNIVVDDRFFVSLEWIENSRGSGLMVFCKLIWQPHYIEGNQPGRLAKK